MGECLPPWYNSPKRDVNLLLFFFFFFPPCPSFGAFHHTTASNVPFKSWKQGEMALYLAATDTAELHWAFAYTPIKAVIKIIVP